MTLEDKILRDEFALAAMHAIILKSPSVTVFEGDEAEDDIAPSTAHGAYEYADAMMAERYERD